MGIFYSTKRFTGFPCTHRQWSAESHCRFVHGYSREFIFEFGAKSLTQQKWVVDFGGLKSVRKWLEEVFDHTFLVSQDDPYKAEFEKLDSAGVIQMRVLPNAGMEATAEYVYQKVNEIVFNETDGRAWVNKVEVRENENNSAIYYPSSK